MELASFLSIPAWRPGFALLAGALTLAVLPACTIEVGPPPESDPPLVAETEKSEPPPVQPTEPQAWSKDLDFDGGEARVREGELADGLVAAEQARAYSGEQLTFRSAEVSEKPPTEAELIRERARRRMLEAQGQPAAAPAANPPLAPPQVVAAPVEEVSAQALPEQAAESGNDDAEELAAQAAEGPADDQPPSEAVQIASAEKTVDDSAVESAKGGSVGAEEGDKAAPEVQVKASMEPAAQPEAAASGEELEASMEPADQPEAAAPGVQSEAGGESATAVQTAALPEAGEPIPEAGPDPASKLLQGNDAPEQNDRLDVKFWDAPVGTILVQVSAIQERQEIAGEWERLKKGYPGVLGPLRLVVEEAKLGDRSAFFRVQAGAFASQEEAEAACVALTDQGQSCLVVERTKQSGPAVPIQAAALPATEEPIQAAGPEPASKLLPDNDTPKQSDSLDAAFWDAPVGTILVQVSAIQDEADIAGEWERLKEAHPEVLGPLRLVVEEAKLGERGAFFRVQAGGFDSKAQARAACESLTEQGQQCFVLEREKAG